MFDLYVMQDQWLMFALIGGVALMFTVLLMYAMIWQKREHRSDQEVKAAAARQGFFAWLASFLPWVLSVIYVATIVYVVVYIIRRATYPPNW